MRVEDKELERMGELTGRLGGCAFSCCVWAEYTNGAEAAFCPGLYGDCESTQRGQKKRFELLSTDTPHKGPTQKPGPTSGSTANHVSIRQLLSPNLSEQIGSTLKTC